MLPRFAVIVAGGQGLRMGGDVPKQFREWRGRPVLMHTLEAFSNCDASIQLVLVLPRDQHDFWKQLVDTHGCSVPHRVVAGGEQRYHSVAEGLAEVPSDAVVAIHDGVRPLVSPELIRRCFEEAEKHGSAVPVTTMVDSLRSYDAATHESHAVDRSKFRAVQTPQTFLSSRIKPLYQKPWQPEWSDDASVYEQNGYRVHLVDGARENIKLTTPEDLAYADFLYELTRT